MANRGATAAALTELVKGKNDPIHLYEAYFDSTTVYATDAPQSIVWNGNTYVAVGHFLTFEGVDETGDLQIAQVQVQLTLADQTWIALVQTEPYIDRRIVIRKGFLNGLGGVVLDPIPVFDGRMDAPAAEEDPQTGEGAVVITATSHWSDFERRPGRHTNHAEQQLHFPDDFGFDYVSEINRPIRWGSLG